MWGQSETKTNIISLHRHRHVTAINGWYKLCKGGDQCMLYFDCKLQHELFNKPQLILILAIGIIISELARIRYNKL